MKQFREIPKSTCRRFRVSVREDSSFTTFPEDVILILPLPKHHHMVVPYKKGDTDFLKGSQP